MPKIHIKYPVILLLLPVVCLFALNLNVLVAHADDAQIVEPANPEEITTREQRIDDRKTEFKNQLDQKALAIFATKCSQVKSTATTLKTKDAKLLTTRHDLYVTQTDKLNYIIQQLQKLNISTVGLETARAQLVTNINRYLADAATYKASLDDLGQINCTQDTAGYKSSILSVRKERATLASDTKAIRATFPSIHSAINAAKNALATTKAGQ